MIVSKTCWSENELLVALNVNHWSPLIALYKLSATPCPVSIEGDVYDRERWQWSYTNLGNHTGPCKTGADFSIRKMQVLQWQCDYTIVARFFFVFALSVCFNLLLCIFSGLEVIRLMPVSSFRRRFEHNGSAQQWNSRLSRPSPSKPSVQATCWTNRTLQWHPVGLQY